MANQVEIDRTIQPAYGVVTTVAAEPVVQAAYGVIPPVVASEPEVQPAYGVVTPVIGTDINISYEELEECISRLKKTINTLKSSWTNGSKKQIARIKQSWVGADCEAYTKKLENMDTKVNNSISALELLCETYEKAKDLIADNQKSTTAAIDKM